MEFKECKCIEDLEQKCNEAARENPTYSESESIESEMESKALFFGKGAGVRAFFEFETKIKLFKQKTGEPYFKKIKQKLVLSKCPFCGQSYE